MPLIVSVLIIISFALQEVIGIDFYKAGIYPRRLSGLSGIMFGPLIHGGYEHLFSNMAALPILMSLLTIIYRRNYFIIFITLYFSTGLLVWILARESYHIGASGVIYALASFMFFSGIISNHKGASAISLLTIMLYGGMIWGLLPGQPHVSWESHALGALAGFAASFVFQREKPKKILTDKDFDYNCPQFKYYNCTTDNTINYQPTDNEKINSDYNYPQLKPHNWITDTTENYLQNYENQEKE